MPSTLKQGQRIKSIFGPWNPEGQSGATLNWNSVTSIEVGQLAGPGGWYDVAVIHHGDGEGDEIIPMHMAETITMEDDPDA